MRVLGIAARVALTLPLFVTSVSRLSSAEPAPALLHVTLPGRTVHNSHYLAASFLYQVQTLLGATATSPSAMDGRIVRRRGEELYLDLSQAPGEKAALLRRIAARKGPADDIGLDELGAYMAEHYYQLTHPYRDLNALRREHPYRDNPNWLTVPVDSMTFRRLRVLRIEKDRIADALAAYFDHNDRVVYPEGTLIVAESFDKHKQFLEAEVLRKRGDTFWNFAVYDRSGALARQSVASDEDGEVAPQQKGFDVPQGCAMCHRLDRLDLSGDPESPVRAPIRAFFHRLPARVPQIHLGPEYYDHMAFTELTEANARAKDGVFGVYGSLLLSELASRKRLGTLTEDDKRRYRRLEPHYPELLTPLERVDSVSNSIGMKLIYIPAPKPGTLVGSPASEPDHRPDEQRHAVRFRSSFFLGVYPVTNAQFRRFRPEHHSPPYRGVPLDEDDQPAVNVSYDDAAAFTEWLSRLPQERGVKRTYRLPTEEEWEYAARAGDDRKYPWGDEWPPPEDAGNFADEANGARFHWEFLRGYRDPFIGTSPVGQFRPNAYFLYDMAGNVYQWTSSRYWPYPGAPFDVRAYNPLRRVMRGSSWADELPKVLRCASAIRCGHQRNQPSWVSVWQQTSPAHEAPADLRRPSFSQKSRRRPNCKVRGSNALVIWPKFAFPRVLPTPTHER